MNKIGVLLINLGTPDTAEPTSVYNYLTEFLSDPRVIDLPMIVRTILTRLIIIPFRYKKSAAAYKKIWTKEGSPLLINSMMLRDDLAVKLGDGYQVELAMRYGKPTIQAALSLLQSCQSIVVLPLFPQYSSAATGSALEQLYREIATQWNIPSLITINDFYDDSGFINAYADIINNALHEKKVDHVLFSYHGLPERHITKSVCEAICDHQSSCPSVGEKNRFCYRAQCYQTTDAIVKAISLPLSHYSVAFQSRLGRTPWIKPYTDQVLVDLRQQGIKNIAIVCPSFVADCLETLEEINIRAREQWQSLGGNEFVFIPCINSSEIWVEGLKSLIIKKSGVL